MPPLSTSATSFNQQQHDYYYHPQAGNARFPNQFMNYNSSSSPTILYESIPPPPAYSSSSPYYSSNTNISRQQHPRRVSISTSSVSRGYYNNEKTHSGRRFSASWVNEKNSSNNVNIIGTKTPTRRTSVSSMTPSRRGSLTRVRAKDESDVSSIMSDSMVDTNKLSSPSGAKELITATDKAVAATDKAVAATDQAIAVYRARRESLRKFLETSWLEIDSLDY
ncbi:11119_t:CDS:2 [Ambispora gerdemannii]|uniref:11119_t:CDS:1 n=1 Tax=Ambispora gerdemannii TaxID=144530 RepID=A0A9N9BXJ0_9GLOM|nr:11119_t:CDS:2 [Ambispora gerdemannii]